MTAGLSATRCGWDGCRALTRDPSGICHHHRRFSGPGPLPGMNPAIPRMRLPDTMQLATSRPAEFRRMLARSVEGMSRHPSVMVSRSTTGERWIRIRNFLPVDRRRPAVYWNGQETGLPAEVEGLRLTMQERDLLVSRSSGVDDRDVRHAAMAAKYQWLTDHAHHYGYLDGGAEEYDDEAEAIAQLDLGSVAGGVLTLMDPGGAGGSEAELFRFTPGVGGGPGLAGSLEASFPAHTPEGEVAVRYHTAGVIVSPAGAVPTLDQVEMLTRLTEVRNVMARYAVQETSGARLYLPLGWTEQPAPRFLEHPPA